MKKDVDDSDVQLVRRGKLVVEFIKNYKYLLYTYLIMLIIPLFVFIGGSYYTSREWKQEAYQYQKAVLSQAASICDNILKQGQVVIYTTVADDDTSQLMRQKEWNGKMMFSVVSLVEKLFNMKNSYDYIDGFGVYFHKNNSFVTDKTRYPVLLQSTYLERYEISTEEFVTLTDNHSGYFLITGDTDTWLVLYQNAYNYSNKVRTATSYAIISCTALEEKLQYLDTLNGSCIFIMDGDGSLIGSTDHTVEIEELSDMDTLIAQVDSGNKLFQSSDNKILTFGMESGEWDIYYGMYLSRDSFYHKVNRFIFCYIVAFILSIILGIVLAVYFTKETSAPINHLLSIIDTNKQKYTGSFMTESCRMLERELLQLKKDNRSLTYQADSYDKQTLERALQGYMRGTYPNEDWVLEFQDKEPRLWNIVEYRVILFCFHNIENSRLIQNQQKNVESYSILFFSLKNVIDEAFLELDQVDNPGISLNMDNMIACIVPVDHVKEQANDDELVSKAKACLDFFNKIFELNAYVAVSNQHDKWTELPEAYEEAYMTATQVVFWGREEPVNFYYLENGESESRDSSELLELKKKLSNCLIVNNYEEAQQVMDEIVDNCFYQDIRYLPYNQCQAYVLIGTLLDKLEDIDIQKQMKADYSARLLRTRSIWELQEEMHCVFNVILEYRRNNLNEPEWVEQVKLYIEENYRDPNMNIAYIANHFAMSPSHVGTRFRKLMGIGILDYIHMTRLQECKEILIQGKTIKCCAEAIGYTDIKTLQRAFKRYEGISPGQYKEEVGQKVAGKTINEH